MDTLFPYTTRFRSVSWRDPDPVSSWQRHLSSPLPSPVRSGRPKGNYLSPRGYGETGRTERYGCRNIDCGGRSPRIVRDIRRGPRIGPSSRPLRSSIKSDQPAGGTLTHRPHHFTDFTHQHTHPPTRKTAVK